MKPRGLYVSPTEFVHFAEPRLNTKLSEQIATRDRSPDFSALGMYLPNPDPILKKQGKDIAVYRELRSDAHVGGCIRRRKAAVKSLEWRIERGKASERSNTLCLEVMQGLDMDRLLNEITEAPLFGWQPLEIVWEHRNGANVPAEVIGKPAEWFHFDAQAQLRFRSRQSPVYGEELEPRKFLLATQEASYANPYGHADLSMCFWPAVFKRGGLKFWVTFTEKYGTPWLVGKTPRGTPGPEVDKLLDQLEAMVQDAVAVIPDDSSVDTLEPGDKGASADLYEKLLMFCRSEISIALLGQNQSTEANSNRASAEAGLQVAGSIRDGDACLAQATVNQLLRWVVDLNEGEGAPAPKFVLYEEESVNEAQANRDEALTRAGVKFSPKYWMRMYKLEEGDLAPVAVAAPAGAGPGAAPGAGLGAPAFAEPARAPAPAPAPKDEIDALVDAALSDWQPLLDPMLEPVQAFLDAAGRAGLTAGEVLERLPELLALMDSGDLADSLTRTTFAARAGSELDEAQQ